MYEWNLLALVWILVAALFAGFGWALGVWILGRILK